MNTVGLISTRTDHYCSSNPTLPLVKHTTPKASACSPSRNIEYRWSTDNSHKLHNYILIRTLLLKSENTEQNLMYFREYICVFSSCRFCILSCRVTCGAEDSRSLRLSEKKRQRWHATVVATVEAKWKPAAKLACFMHTLSIGHAAKRLASKSTRTYMTKYDIVVRVEKYPEFRISNFISLFVLFLI